jgi:hypothetical protein
MREAYYEVARRRGTILSQLLADVMKANFPELEEIVEQVVKAGGPDAYRMKMTGTPRRRGSKPRKHLTNPQKVE